MKKDPYHTIEELSDHVLALGGVPALTMKELYEQRTRLSIDLFNRQTEGEKWKAISEPGWMAYGWEHPQLGKMGYHCPMSYWDQYDAPEVDFFRTDNKTLDRLVAFNWGNQHRDRFRTLR